MPNNQFPKGPAEVAHDIGVNVRRQLAAKGRDLHWLADQIDISAHKILELFSTAVPGWFLFDTANALGVSASVFLEEPS